MSSAFEEFKGNCAIVLAGLIVVLLAGYIVAFPLIIFQCSRLSYWMDVSLCKNGYILRNWLGGEAFGLALQRVLIYTAASQGKERLRKIVFSWEGYGIYLLFHPPTEVIETYPHEWGWFGTMVQFSFYSELLFKAFQFIHRYFIVPGNVPVAAVEA